MSSLNQLIQKLAGAQTNNDKTEPSDSALPVEVTDSVYVEKLASAVDFIIDNWSDAPKADDDSEKVASVVDLSEKLRAKLQEKLADKQEKDSEHDSEFIDSIMHKLQELKAERLQQEEDVREESNEIEELNLGGEEESETEEESTEDESVSEEADEAVAKAASAENTSLSDVLSAALSTTSDHNESAKEISEGTKTAGVAGSDGPMARKEATEILKQKLMANLGQED